MGVDVPYLLQAIPPDIGGFLSLHHRPSLPPFPIREAWIRMMATALHHCVLVDDRQALQYNLSDPILVFGQPGQQEDTHNLWRREQSCRAICMPG